MRCITRSIVRWGLIGGLALGGITLLVGPERVAAGFSQMRSKAQQLVDRHVDDPVALRHQLQAMADQYPKRIAEVRGELAEVDRQLGQFDRDIDISKRVIAMTADDLGQLRELVTRAETEAETTARPVAIRFEGIRFDLEQAYNEARRINNVRLNYQDRLAHNRQQADILSEQKTRLAQILDKLETEYATYQNQLWQMDRQIDAIERNERLIAMTEQLEQTLNEYDKFGEVGNLKQLEGKLAHLQAVQQAQLESLSKRGINRNYEDRAVYELEDFNDETNPFEDVDELVIPQLDDNADDAKSSDRSLAWRGPLVIE